MGPWRDTLNPFSGGREGLKYFSLSLASFPSLSPFLSFFPFLFFFFFFSSFFFGVRVCGVLQHPKHPPWTRHWYTSGIVFILAGVYLTFYIVVSIKHCSGIWPWMFHSFTVWYQHLVIVLNQKVQRWLYLYKNNTQKQSKSPDDWLGVILYPYNIN